MGCAKTEQQPVARALLHLHISKHASGTQRPAGSANDPIMSWRESYDAKKRSFRLVFIYPAAYCNVDVIRFNGGRRLATTKPTPTRRWPISHSPHAHTSKSTHCRISAPGERFILPSIHSSPVALSWEIWVRGERKMLIDFAPLHLIGTLKSSSL